MFDSLSKQSEQCIVTDNNLQATSEVSNQKTSSPLLQPLLTYQELLDGYKRLEEENQLNTRSKRTETESGAEGMNVITPNLCFKHAKLI